MAESECAAYKELKDRETRAHTAWTSFLYRNEVKPKLSEERSGKHQKEEMEAYEQAHKARLAHVKTCPICRWFVQPRDEVMPDVAKDAGTRICTCDSTQLGYTLAHHQHFPNGIARQKKFDRSEIPEEVFNVPVVEHALQARGLFFRRGTPGRRELHLLHLQHVGVGDMIAIAGRIRARVPRVKECQQ